MFCNRKQLKQYQPTNACKEAESEYIPLKPKDKYRVPCNTALVQNKLNELKKEAVLKNSNLTRTNKTKYKKAHSCITDRNI